MKISKFLIFLLFTINSISLSQLHIGAKFTPKLSATKPDSAWFGDIGIRAAHISDDLDKDGKPEIWVTDYTKSGRVHAFQATGNDTLEWIYSSPRLDTVTGTPYGAGGGSTPRVIRSGDLDSDGKGEIIFPRSGTTGGLLVFEWNGVVGSHKFGNKPSAVVSNTITYAAHMGTLAGQAVEGGLQTTIEFFDIFDVDKDGQQEILLPKNVTGTTNDDFLI
ncbi:MAG: VCBS repeat-containing protein, partial [Bacteroidetes bacterium]|nr:VCBS repeat-containing protein [Bacteroidota bacterium]